MSFYYLDTANTVVGPMELSEIACLVEGGTLPEDVLVCRAEEESWRPLSSLIPDTKTPDVPKSGPSTSGTGHWLPGAVLTTGIVALLLSGLPVLAGLLGTAAIGGGVANLSGWNPPRGRGLSIGGVILGSLALLAAAGGLIESGGGMSARAISKVLKEDRASWSQQSAPIRMTPFPRPVSSPRGSAVSTRPTVQETSATLSSNTSMLGR